MEKSVAPSIVSLLAGAAAAVSFASPAAAQSFSKTEAILGGPSALEALKAQQSGRPFAAPARTISQPAMQPASLSYRPMVSAVFRDRPMVSPGVVNGRPDVFGTVALRVGRTPLDARWHKVEYSPVRGTAARFADTLRGKDTVERLEAVNWYVNKRVRFVDEFGPVRPARRMGRRQRHACAAAAAIARISPSPSCRCCAAPESPTATFIW